MASGNSSARTAADLDAAGGNSENNGGGAEAGRASSWQGEVRAYEARDLKRIEMLHAIQGLPYDMPDLNDPIFAIGKVAEKPPGTAYNRIEAAAFLKIEAEAYLFLNPNYSDPQTRWQMLLALHEEVRREAAALGLSEVFCAIPPGLPKSFHRRLKRLGWHDEPSDWQRKSFHLRKVTL
jgi:hypothetical protein